MPILKDKETEQLRQLVKACLLEISKLKIDLKKCQQESQSKVDSETIKEKDQLIKKLENSLKENQAKIDDILKYMDEKDAEMEELKKIKLHFDAITARPKKDLTSFQSQVYGLLKKEKSTTEDHYDYILNIGFKELSFDNFNSILRNLERKKYVKSHKENDKIIWEKIEK